MLSIFQPSHRISTSASAAPETSSPTYLVESESIWADPRMLHAVLAVMEDFAVQLLVGVVTGLLLGAVELGLLQQGRQTVWFLLLFFQLVFGFLLELLELGWVRAVVLVLRNRVGVENFSLVNRRVRRPSN